MDSEFTHCQMIYRAGSEFSSRIFLEVAEEHDIDKMDFMNLGFGGYDSFGI